MAWLVCVHADLQLLPVQAALEYDPCSSSPFNSFASAVDCPDR